MPDRPGVGTPLKAVAAIATGLYLALVVAWGLDLATHRGEAMRGVTLAGLSVEGQDRERLTGTVATVEDELTGRAVDVEIGDTTIGTDLSTLGLRLDTESMVDDALDARRGGFLPFRPIGWFFALFSDEDVPPRYTVDETMAAAAVNDVLAPELDQPREPAMELADGELRLVPGAIGITVDPDEVITSLPAAVADDPPQLTLTANQAAPEWTDDEVGEVIATIDDRTDEAIMVLVLDQETEVPPDTLKTWLRLDLDGEEPTWTVDEELALEDLKPLFPTLGTEDQQARFSVVANRPIIIPASETVICCDAGAGAVLRAAIRRIQPTSSIPTDDGADDEDEATDDETVTVLRRARLQPEVTGEDEGVAELQTLGIVEEVSTFTTNHACCQNRVLNIQRFADLMQGVIIRPGETFSLNEHVGQRTVEKGFVADGAIVLGNFEPQVGGGISQYATTFFNASFFAGLEFVEYQSHSIYISRYPRGREATISWRRPDLKVRNTTDYGILVWNDYTDTSITVSFYSTKHLEVEALDLRRSSDRRCRIDITPRLITYPDGTEVEDTVFALYRPGEGLDCNGDSTTPEEDEAEAAAAAPAPPPEPPAGDGADDDGDDVLPPG
ncbi:MAG: VanW family protein [Actinomycetota bacterium]